jgi:putative chitinase
MSAAAPIRKPDDPTVAPTWPLLRRLRVAQPQAWSAALAPHCARHRIDTPARLAAFLANALHETAGFARLEENLNYTAGRLMAVWPSRFPSHAAARPFAHMPEDLANRVYGGRMGNLQPGDGWMFRGRGLLMTTGRDNYARLGIATGRTPAELTEWLLTLDGAAESAVRYWTWRACNAPADAGDLEEVRRRINGGLIGIDDVRRRHAAVLAAIGKEFPGT